MNKVMLNGKEVDIDCSHNKFTTSFLEGIYEGYLVIPVLLTILEIFIRVVTGKISSNLSNVTITWALASIILMKQRPKWEPKTLDQINYEEWVLNKQLPQ